MLQHYVFHPICHMLTVTYTPMGHNFKTTCLNVMQVSLVLPKTLLRNELWIFDGSRMRMGSCSCAFLLMLTQIGIWGGQAINLDLRFLSRTLHCGFNVVAYQCIKCTNTCRSSLMWPFMCAVHAPSLLSCLQHSTAQPACSVSFLLHGVSAACCLRHPSSPYLLHPLSSTSSLSVPAIS